MDFIFIIMQNLRSVNIDITPCVDYNKPRCKIKNYRMNCYACFQIVFSSTGGTQKVADIITSKWDKAAETIDLSDAKTDFTTVRL